MPRWISDSVPTVLPETKVIHLLRDPRDVWLSIAGFNAKRGFFSFGRNKDQKDEEFFEDFVAAQRLRLEPLVGREFGANQRLLRYEDMMRDPEGTAASLGDWLGLDLDVAAIAVREGKHVRAVGGLHHCRVLSREPVRG